MEVKGSEKVENLVFEDKNKYTIVCKKCSSKILKPGTGKLIDKKFPLPHFTQAKNATYEDSVCEDLEEYWQIDDKFHFENIGFSKIAPSGHKFLLCADCEIGPLGYLEPPFELCCLAVKRVKYLNSDN